MIKSNLPVIILKGIILLPNNDIRLEFSSEDSKNIIDLSEMFHDNKILVVSTLNITTNPPKLDKLPKIGVISTITHRMELPNGKTRVIITGEKRAQIHEYLNLNNSFEVLESIVSTIEEEKIDDQEEKVIIRKLYREIEDCSKKLPNLGNSVLALIVNSTNLSKMTDIIAPYLPIEPKRLNEYLEEIKTTSRAKYILEDLYKEKELYENLDELQDEWELVEESEENTYFDIEYYYRTYKRK